MDSYGAKLKRLRLINGKNQEEIAEVIDRTKRSVYNYEIGKGQISLENAIKFCMECGEDISYLQDNEIINADVIAVYTNEYGMSKYFSGTTYFMANVINDYENKKVLCIDVGLNGRYEIDKLFGIYEGNHEQESKLNRKTMNVFDINIP